jgi:hypothetical protein
MPWKFFTCLLVFGLCLGTVYFLDLVLPGETTDALIRVTDRGLVFSIKSMKSQFLHSVFFCTFFGYPLLALWLCKPLREEMSRVSGRAPTNAAPLGAVVAYGAIGLLIAFLVLIMVTFMVIRPWNEVYRVTVRGDDVLIESMYRRWEVTRSEIDEVEITRSVENGRGGEFAAHRATIHLKNGKSFRTSYDLRARPPSGQEDIRHEKFFDDLLAELKPQ